MFSTSLLEPVKISYINIFVERDETRTPKQKRVFYYLIEEKQESSFQYKLNSN